MSKRPRLLPALLLIAVTGSFSLNSAAEENSWFKSGQDLLDSIMKNKPADSVAGELSGGEISDGLKEALRVGTENVVTQLGQRDGFYGDKAIRIPLPSQLESARNILDRVGMASLMDDLELKLNRAAELAAPQAKTLFWDAIKEMSFDDARRIYSGPDDAATRYLSDKMSGPLGQMLRPLIQDSLAEAGAVKAYDEAIGSYQNIPFVPDVKANLTDYTVDKSMHGMFYYLAREEAAIRKDPLKRSTDLLRRVFGR